MDTERLLDGLNEAQARAVTSAVVPMCILAGAGSGKTRVLTRRIAYRAATSQHDPQRVLALTFTRKAAGELSSRLRKLGLRDSVVAGTFHAVAYAQLRSRWADNGINPPALLDRKVGFVSRVMQNSTIEPVERKGAKSATVLDVVTEIEWAKARRIKPDQYPSAAKAFNRTPPVSASDLKKLYQGYEDEKKQRRMVDFDDLLALCARDLTRDPAFGDAQRWRYRHFFVDEYQDVNPLQQALLEAWLGDRTDLCVVGDPNQAIYAWNGADAKNLTEFTERWKRGEVVRLSENYRSSPQILAAANAVLGSSLAANRATAAGEHVGTLRANRPSGPVPVIRALPDDKAEAQAIARAARDRHGPGTSWSAQAVLVRTNAQIGIIEEAFRAVRIPFRVKGGSGLLDQSEVKDAIRELKHAGSDFAIALKDLEITASRIGDYPIDGPTRAGLAIGLDDDDIAELADEARADEVALRLASGENASASTGRSADESAAEPIAALSPADEERRANLQSLVRLGHDFAAIESVPTVSGFLGWLSATTRADQPDAQGDAIDIMTFHSAKGLEWPIVHLAGLEQGLVPIGHARTPSEIAEERRLFYVGVTRAERELLCTWSEKRTFGTQVADRKRSPYLKQVEIACDAVERDEVPEDWADFFQKARAQGTLDFDDPDRPGPDALPGADAAVSGRPKRQTNSSSTRRIGGALLDLTHDDQELLEKLKDWRLGVAKAASTPDYVVFPDTALHSIAKARPKSQGSLEQLKGVTPLKAKRYGEAVIKIVTAHH